MEVTIGVGRNKKLSSRSREMSGGRKDAVGVVAAVSGVLQGFDGGLLGVVVLGVTEGPCV